MMDIFSSTGASLLVLLVQGLFAWALWSLRRAFVRQEDYLLHVQRDTRREAATTRRLSAIEENLRLAPDTADLAGCTTSWRPCAVKSRRSMCAFLAWTGCLRGLSTALSGRKTVCASCLRVVRLSPAAQGPMLREAATDAPCKT